MLRLVRMVRAAARGIPCALLCALAGTAACGAELAQEPEGPAPAQPPPPRVRSTKLAIQRRADGLEQVSLQGLPQHVTRARTASDGGVQHQCASDAP